MLKRHLALVVAIVLLPAAAKAQNAGAIAGVGFYSGIMTMACALFVAGARGFEDQEGREEDKSEVDYSRRGVYLDGGLAYAYGFPGSTGGPRIHVGYRCHERFAADLEYEGLYIEGLQRGPVKETDSYWSVAYNAKVFLTTDRIQPFLVFGFGVAGADRKFTAETNTDVLINAGFGVDAWLTESLALSLDVKYVALTGGASDLGHMTLGYTLKYKF